METQSEPTIFINYAPTIDPSRDLYDADTIVITVLDEDFAGHEGLGVPMIAIEKGRHEYPEWIQPLVQKHCEEMLTSGRMNIEVVPLARNQDVAQVTNFEKPTPQVSTVFLPYVGTPFECLTKPVSEIKALALIPEELRMDAVGLLCTELEGSALLQQLKRWARDPFLKPGVKTRLTKLIRKLEGA